MIEVQVTQADIDEGVCGNAGKCAVALAVSRLFPGHLVVVNSFGGVGVGKNPHDTYSWYNGTSPEEEQRLQTFIAEFDWNRGVRPTTFKLEEHKR